MTWRRHAYIVFIIFTVCLSYAVEVEASPLKTLVNPAKPQETQTIPLIPYTPLSGYAGFHATLSFRLPEPERFVSIEGLVRKVVQTLNSFYESLKPLKVGTVGAVAYMPLELGNGTRPSSIQFFEPDGYPPEPWSRLREETATEYVYETAWGIYRLSKTLPVFSYFSHEEGFCRVYDTVDDSICLDFYSNRPYNTTSGFWLYINGASANFVSYAVWQAGNNSFMAEATVSRQASVYRMRMTWNFTASRTGPKIAVEVFKTSGPDRVFQVVWFGLARGYVDALGVDVSSLGGVSTPLGTRDRIRLSFSQDHPDTWRQFLEIDWRDEGPAETWLTQISLLGLSFYGWLVKYREGDGFIDPSVQVFGPNTVDPGFNSTGEKTLLTMNTTLAAGGKNVIIAVLMFTSVFESAAQGTFRIKKGATTLYGTYLTEYLNTGGARSMHVMVMAVDTSPSGNDSYTFTVNITTAGSTTGNVHVQGMVIKSDDAGWGYNTTAVSIPSGSTQTVTSLTTNYASGSKVAVLAYVYASHSGSGSYFIGGGNIRLKLGTNVLSSNQFSVGSWSYNAPLRVSISYLGQMTSSNQTWSVEIYNNSGINFPNCYAEIVALTVADGSFLDTASVTLTNGSQVTVGSLSTSLSGDVAVIALAAAENPGASNVVAFNANDVVLQKDNSSTGQINNLVGWFLERNDLLGRSGILPLLRVDTGVTNPSYQVKMTARVNNINGEAKIVAFTMPSAGQSFTVNLSEALTATGTITRIPNYVRVLAQTLTAADTLSRLQVLVRGFSETVSVGESMSRTPNYVRLLAETLSVIDTLSRLQTLTRGVSETVSAGETISRTGNYARILAETLTLSDSVTRRLGFTRGLSETLTAADIIDRIPNYVRLLAETLTGSDTSSRLQVLVRSMSETATAGESMSRTPNYVRIIGETLTASDSVTRVQALIRGLLETLTASDTIDRSASYFRAIVETLTATDTLSRLQSLTRDVSENVAAGDTVSRTPNYSREIAETLTATDTPSRLQILTRDILETITAVETMTRTPTFVRAIVETLTAVDALSRLQTLNRGISETVSAGESLSRTPNYFRDLAETLTATDTSSRLQSLTRGVSENVSAGESMSRTPNYIRSIAESLTAEDALTRTAAYIRIISENVGITSNALLGGFILTILESVVIYENMQVLRTPSQAAGQQPSGPPVTIPISPTPQQFLPVGLAVTLGVVLAGAGYAMSRRRPVGVLVSKSLEGINFAAVDERKRPKRRRFVIFKPLRRRHYPAMTKQRRERRRIRGKWPWKTRRQVRARWGNRGRHKDMFGE